MKLRDCNRLTFERILSDPNEQIGTIVAQATVEPITLPNGGGIALIQETTLYEEDYGLVSVIYLIEHSNFNDFPGRFIQFPDNLRNRSELASSHAKTVLWRSERYKKNDRRNRFRFEGYFRMINLF